MLFESSFDQNIANIGRNPNMIRKKITRRIAAASRYNQHSQILVQQPLLGGGCGCLSGAP